MSFPKLIHRSQSDRRTVADDERMPADAPQPEIADASSLTTEPSVVLAAAEWAGERFDLSGDIAGWEDWF